MIISIRVHFSNLILFHFFKHFYSNNAEIALQKPLIKDMKNSRLCFFNIIFYISIKYINLTLKYLISLKSPFLFFFFSSRNFTKDSTVLSLLLIGSITLLWTIKTQFCLKASIYNGLPAGNYGFFFPLSVTPQKISELKG